MKLSVVVPVYNCASYLERSIGSVLSFENADLEVVAVNDGSTDGSLEVLRSLAQHDERLIVVDKENGGVSSARNMGIDIACGDFIGFLDADDLYAPGAINRITQTLANSDGVDVLLFGYSEKYTDTGQVVPRVSHKTPTNGQEVLARYYSVGEDSMFGSVWLAFVSRALIKRTGAQFEVDMALYEDLMFMSRVMQASEHLTYLEEPLYFYCRPKKLHYEALLSQSCYALLYRHMRKDFCLPKDLVEANCIYNVTRDLAHCLADDHSYKKFKGLLAGSFECYSTELGRIDELKGYLPKKIYIAAQVFIAWGYVSGLKKAK